MLSACIIKTRPRDIFFRRPAVSQSRSLAVSQSRSPVVSQSRSPAVPQSRSPVVPQSRRPAYTPISQLIHIVVLRVALVVFQVGERRCLDADVECPATVVTEGYPREGHLPAVQVARYGY